MGSKGAGSAFYRPEGTALACGTCRGCGGAVGSGWDSTRVLAAHGGGDDPDRWAPPVGGREGRKGWEAGLGRGKGVGRRVEISWAARKKKERKRAGRAEAFWAERGFFFLSFVRDSNKFNLNSNLKNSNSN